MRSAKKQSPLFSKFQKRTYTTNHQNPGQTRSDLRFGQIRTSLARSERVWPGFGHVRDSIGFLKIQVSRFPKNSETRSGQSLGGFLKSIQRFLSDPINI